MSDKVAHRASTVLDDLLTYVSQQTGLDVGQFEWYSWPHYFPTTAGPRGAGGSSMTAHQIIAFEAYGPNPSNAESVYYSVLRLKGDGMEALRAMFPEGEASDLDAVLFSTSGVHGTYCLIEAVDEDMQRAEREGPRDVTFCVIQPRIVCMRYGTAVPRTPDDIAFLKKLRASSLRALATIGMPTSSAAAMAWEGE